MNWTPVTMQWPTEATAWMDQMDSAKDMATAQLDSAYGRLATLAEQVIFAE